MKKKIGYISMALISSAMFFNANLTTKSASNSNLDLANLITISNANAESTGTYMHSGWCPNSWFSYGTYCNETKTATNCSSPSC